MTRTCKWHGCGRRLLTQRVDAEFCSDACRTRYKNERRRQGSSSDTRVNGQSSGVGGRGGNIRDLTEARGLQEEQKEKARWTLIVRERISRTLIETGYLHADDLDALGVPPAHCNVKGSQIGSFRSRGLMEKTGQERKVSHPAANGRRAPIYRISAKGRKELPRLFKDLIGVGGGDHPVGSFSLPTEPGHSPHSGEKQIAQIGADDPDPATAADCSEVALREPIPLNANEGQSGGEVSTDLGDDSSAAGSPSTESAEESPRPLFELEPERPRSAWTDAEAA